MHDWTHTLETWSISAVTLYAIEGLIVLWPLPSGRLVLSCQCSLQRVTFMKSVIVELLDCPLLFRNLPRNTGQLTALPLCLLLPGLWSPVPNYRLYSHSLSVPHSLIFFFPLKLDWISKAIMSSVALKCHLLQQLIQGFLCRLVNEHSQTVDKWPSVCLCVNTVYATVATN